MLHNSLIAKQLLSKDRPDFATVLQILDEVIALNRRANEMVRRLRNLLTKRKLELRAVSLNKLIIEAAELVRHRASLKKVKISTDLAHNLPQVRGDRIQLQQVCLNLLVNALEAMRRIPGRRREISIRTSLAESGFVTLEVQDSGPGIVPDKLEAVFNPYFTTKSKSMGLGLSICRSIVKAHHGKISATNTPGRGATFCVELPVVPSSGNGN
jgi:signal transduction histidine kinase